MADIEQPLQDNPFMAPLSNDEMDSEFSDYGSKLSPTSSTSSFSSYFV